MAYRLCVNSHLGVVRVDILVEEKLGDVSDHDQLAESILEVHALSLHQYDDVLVLNFAVGADKDIHFLLAMLFVLGGSK